MPLAAARIEGAPTIAAGAVAFGAALYAPLRAVRGAAPSSQSLETQLSRFLVAVLDAAFIGFVPFICVAIATTKGGIGPILAILGASILAASHTWRSALAFAALATAAYIADMPSVAWVSIAAASLCLAGSVPSESSMHTRLVRSFGLGGLASYLTGLFWHHMVWPLEFVMLVAAGFTLASAAAVLPVVPKACQKRLSRETAAR